MSWKRPAFALASVLLFFAVVEAILAIAGVSSLLDERDPFQGFSDSVRVFRLDAERQVYRTPRQAIRHSFNYQEFAKDKPVDGIRVFVIGGSSAYGFPWGAGAAFTRLLGDALRASWPGRNVEAVNAGAMSYGSHRLRILTPEILSYRPDVLVVYGGHNEFVERRFYRDLIDRPGRLDPFRRLLYRWRLFAALTRLRERIAPEGRVRGAPEPGQRTTGELLGLDVAREYSVDVGPEETAQVRDRFEENLRAILDMARSSGVRVALCTVPSNLRDWVPNQSFFGSAGGTAERRTVNELIAGARSALEAGDAGSAAADLERAVALAPRYAEAHYLLGQAYEALGRWDDARDAYVRARDTDAQPARAVSVLNDTLRRLAREEAGVVLVDVERVFQRESPHGLPGFDLFEDYVHPNPAGHRVVARELWRAILEQGLLGTARAADDREFDEAIAVAAEDAPDPGAARVLDRLFNLALVLENQGLVDEAVRKYHECIDLEPRHYAARFNLARLLYRGGRLAEAAEQYRLALDGARGGPLYVRTLIGLGETLRALERPDEAREALEQAARQDPRSAPAWTSLGGVLLDVGRHGEAETAFRRAIEIEPGNAEIHANLGFTLIFQNEIEAAEDAFRSGLALAPDHARCRNGLGAALTERGELDRAERLFRESLRIDPGDELARGGLAVIERRRKKGEKGE